MGGNAVKHFGSTVRFDRQQLDALIQTLKTSFPVPFIVPPFLQDKESFGDLDVLVASETTPENDVLEKVLGAKGFVENGNCTSFAVIVDNDNIFQVDVIRYPEKDLAFATHYMSYGGIGNYVGKVARYYGLKLTDRVLVLPYDPQGKNNVSDIVVTNDFHDALNVLGYPPLSSSIGVTEQTFFDYLASGKHTISDMFEPDELNHVDRVRQRKRPTFSRFVDYLQKKRHESLIDIWSKGYFKTDEGRRFLIQRYPSIEKDMDMIVAERRRQDIFREKFNGGVVKSVTGLGDYTLGKFMESYTQTFGSKENFQTFVLTHSTDDIRLSILAHYAFQNVSKDIDAYIVGGAVRDALLGVPSKDIDFVVVGQTSASMEQKGFFQIGKDFPVFVSAENDGKQFALARKERNAGPGHRDFDVETTRVSISADLFRRDLTINAMAVDRNGQLIDLFGGYNDLKNGVMKAVSHHFVEDPLRALRVARQTAKLSPIYESMGKTLTVDPSLMATMKDVVKNDGLAHLPKERIFQEILLLLTTEIPSRGLSVLHQCGALEKILPEVAALDGVKQDPKWHPEGDAFVHTLMVVDKTAEANAPLSARFAALVHDVGKSVTTTTEIKNGVERIHHFGHEKVGVPMVETLCERLAVPNDWRKLAIAVTANHLKVHQIDRLKSSKTYELLDAIGGTKKESLGFLNAVLAVCQADDSAKERMGDYQPGILARRYSNAVLGITGETLIKTLPDDKKDLHGADFGRRLREMRIKALQDVKNDREKTLDWVGR